MIELTNALRTFWINLAAGQLVSLGDWNYVLLALVVAIEGPIATLLGAAAASAGWLNPLLVFVAAAVGNLMADTLWYLLGYLGKVEWVLHYGKWLGLRREHIAQFEQKVRTHTRKLLIVGKLTSSPMIPTLIATGLARVPWWRWFGALFVAECVWTGGLVLAGYYLSESIKRLQHGVEIVGLGGIVVFILLLAWYFLAHHNPLKNTEL